ncbi:hypothetical protein M7I_1118 [Glarea lozoyensis 74030]|uniref:Uncharacterized protein n=1 Tax=Glarea lozoyensis (strain ATCC 74030 / MF5533) TaxID=1104152 RepID=H0EF79_GLAL7|nr:hypothetical protein M7I_1118 [Glarea lozoyensis 74030]
MPPKGFTRCAASAAKTLRNAGGCGRGRRLGPVDLPPHHGAGDEALGADIVEHACVAQDADGGGCVVGGARAVVERGGAVEEGYADVCPREEEGEDEARGAGAYYYDL